MKKSFFAFLIVVPFVALCHAGQAEAPPMRCLAFSPDGKWLVAGGGTVRPRGGAGIVKVWETRTWKIHSRWEKEFTDYVGAVFFSSDDTVAAVSRKMIRGSRGDPNDGTLVRYWNVRDKKELKPLHLKDQLGWGGGIAFFSPGKLIAYYRSDQKIGVYTAPNLQEKVLLKDCPAAYLHFLPDGKRLVAGTRSATIPQARLYNATNGDVVSVYKLEPSNDETMPTEVRAIDVSPNGKLIAIGTAEPNRVYVLAADMKVALFTLNTGSRYPDCVKFGPKNDTVAIGKGRSTVQLYSIKTKKLIKIFDKNPDGVNGWCFSPDGVWIAIGTGGHPQDSGTSSGRVRVFEVKTGKLVAELD